MANRNKSLNEAGKAKKDEFYTQLSDIQQELNHYIHHFENKVVFCNCDDPYESNFFKFFCMNFRRFKLKKLIATYYTGSPIAESEVGLFKEGFIADEPIPEKGKRAIQFRISEIPDMNGDGAIDLRDAELLIRKRHPYRILHGDEKYPAGDFRSKECIELLKQCDIVVTNPPFSLFREYVATMVEYNKKFIAWGNMNAVTYKDFFPLLKNGKVWTGYTFNKTNIFEIPNYYEQYDEKITKEKNDGKKYCKVPAITVYTNLDIPKHHEELILTETYNQDKYPKYINYDAINVDKVANIPMDYNGLMGVPISFLDKYNPKQFELLGTSLELATPMKEVAEKGSYMSGGNRFYTPLITDKDNERGYKYHREYDRIVIRKIK